MAMNYQPQQHEPPAVRPRPRWPWIAAAFSAAIAAAVGITLALTGSDKAAESAQTSSTTAEPAGRSAPIHADTITACRSLADSEQLAAFWREVNNGRTPSPIVAGHARMAVIQLGNYVDDPDVDPAVADAMAHAVVEVVGMTGKPLDVDEFRAAITPVVDACQALEVDMGMPE